MKKKSVLVVFGEKLPRGWQRSRNRYAVVVAREKLRHEVQAADREWINLETLIESGSVYEASAFLEELSRLTFPDGSRLAKACLYKGYELWWTHYDNLFLHFCLPYTQYRKLLEYLKTFQHIYLYRPPHKALFSYYLQAYGSSSTILRESGLKSHSPLPFGVFIQILITMVSLPILILQKRRLMVFIGDKFGKNRDYDFRMRFIYEELRGRNIRFVEFVRSLESWRIVLAHAWIRRRPVIYSEAVTFIGRFCSILSGGHARAQREFVANAFAVETSPETRFKFLVATQYLLTAHDDIWAIRIMKWLLHAIGIKAACMTAATERSWHTVLGCKLSAIPTIGILHGVASRHYVTSDFLPGFDGTNMLSVDRYGLWSEWWREYYLKYSKAYRAEQLYVSGPMRPLESGEQKSNVHADEGGHLKVLFIGEQQGYPAEALPYVSKLINTKGIDLYVKFRPYRDGFEEWMKKHHPELLREVKILKGSIEEATSICDVVVGSHSTAALEALFALKPPIFYETKKWGDYFDLKEYHPTYAFFAKTPEELVQCILKSREIPVEVLEKLRERYFGDPHKNGSKWVVDQAEKILLNSSPLVR